MEKLPVCGVDFCYLCGDCLVCYGDDKCEIAEDGKHEPYKEPEETSAL